MSAPEPAAVSPAFPATLLSATARVEGRVDDLLSTEVDRWRTVADDLAGPLESLRDLVRAGGKRLRPAFCLVAYLGAGGRLDAPEVLEAACALELVHTFALVHDDVMDGSERRRGASSIHHRFAAVHLDSGWHGEPRRYGEGMAILVGDFAVVYADMFMRSAPPAALEIYDELRIELCIGQTLDLTGTARPGTDPTEARRITRFKSAKYTVERPLHLGAALLGRIDELAAPLSRIGAPLGEAFQLRDDLLGVFGEATILGKPVGEDLREGKSTPLLAIATQRARGSDREVLERLGTTAMRERDVDRARDVLVSCGAVDVIENEITALVDSAEAAIRATPITTESKELLGDLARYVAWRDS